MSAATEDSFADLFKSVMGSFTTGVTVVATRSGGLLHGMTVSAFSSVSLDPPMALVCLKPGAMRDYIVCSGSFTVTFLSADQQSIGLHFARSDRGSASSQFADIDWHPAPRTGNPVVSGGLAYVDCLLDERVEAGDHTIMLGSVADLGLLRETEPLIYFGSRFWDLKGAA